MRPPTYLIPPLAALLAGCASMAPTPLARPHAAARAEVLVYREPAMNAGGLSLAVGAGADAFARLETREFVLAELPAGRHTLFVRARQDRPAQVEVELRAGERVCLRASPDPANVAKILVPPVMMATGYWFQLEQVPCPAGGAPAGYRQVPVAYRAP